MAIAKLAKPERETTARGRFYTWKGQSYPSVTTALQIISKPHLMKWAAKMVAEKAVEIADDLPRRIEEDLDATLRDLKRAPDERRDRSADLGTFIHDTIEAYILDVAPATHIPDEAKPYLQSFRDFLADLRPSFEAVEATVYSRAFRYAGSADAFATIGGEPVVIDWKTGKSIYRETALQLAAYRYGEFVGLPDGSEAPVPRVQGAYIVHLKPKGYTLQRVAADDVAFAAFRNALYLWRYVQDVLPKAFIAEGDE